MRYPVLLFSVFLFTSSLHSQDIREVLKHLSTDKQKADTLLFHSRAYILKAKADSALYWLETGEVFAVNSGYAELMARYNIEKAGVACLKGRYRVALTELAKADPYLDQHDFYTLKITSLTTKANCYNFLDKKDSALHYYKQAEVYNNRNNPYRNWVVYTAMGELFNRADDTEEAEQYYLKAYNITVDKAGKPDLGYVLMLLSNFYIARNKPEKAGRIVQEYYMLMEERKKTKFTDPLQNIIQSITGSRFENNVAFMQEVKESSLENGHRQEAVIANGYIINYYEKRENYAEALKYAEENDSIASGLESLYSQFLTKQSKFNLLKKMGKHAEANTAAESMLLLKDSLQRLEHREQLYSLEKKYESEKKQKEIDLLASRNALNEKNIQLLTNDKKLAALVLQQEIIRQNALTRENQLMDSVVNSEKAYSKTLSQEKEKENALNESLARENQLRQAELEKEKKLRWVITGGAILLLLAAGIILFQYRKQRTRNMLIQKQSADLEVLMKEIHHRVKNNLQIVSSLLDLQSHSIRDAQAHEAVKEGKNRVQSMALIHQNLYSLGNIKGIRVKEYVSNLLMTLCDSYNISNDNVRINAEIDDLNLDVDTMIPLGLVLNELVSNSFKYAFRDMTNGKLCISLKEDAGLLYLQVRDNGKGFPENLDLQKSRSFGLKMIRAFSQKLKAQLDIHNDNGAVVIMKISKFKTA